MSHAINKADNALLKRIHNLKKKLNQLKNKNDLESEGVAEER
jgi:hypothetical protein